MFDMNEMSGSRDLLVQAAARLYTLGVDLECAKEELRRLVETGESYSSPKMREACEACEALHAQWKALEQEYLALRRERAAMQETAQEQLRQAREAE